MIARGLAALVLGLSSMLAAVVGSAALSAEWAWMAQWLVPLAGLVTCALCFTAGTGMAAWARGLVMAGALYSGAAVVLFAAPGAVMKDAGQAVGGMAEDVGRKARETSTGDTEAQRTAEGAMAGVIVATMGLMGAAFGVVFLIGLALMAGGIHLAIGLILMLVNRRQTAGAGG